MKVLILRSVESQYVRIIGVPFAMPMEAASTRVQELIEEVKASSADGNDELLWTWEDIEERLVQDGFIACEWFHGPYWDGE